MKEMLPCYCPSCRGRLKVSSLGCEACGTAVSGSYPLPVLALLSPEEQKFVLAFVKSSGSLKEMSAQMKLSYPTVRNLLNEMIAKIESYEKESETAL